MRNLKRLNLYTIFCTLLFLMTIVSDAYPQAALQLKVEGSTGVKLRSIGVEFDPHFFSQNIARNNGTKKEDWNKIIVKRVKSMKLKSYRVMVLPHWYEPLNDNEDSDVADRSNFKFDSPEMKSLYKVLDLAENEGADVTLVLWGAAPSHFLGKGNYGDWMVAAKDYDEWSENFAELVKYLVIDRKYKCIKEVTPVNEPDWAFIAEGKVHPVSEYIKMCKRLASKFKEEGIRDKVIFNLSDNSDGGSGTHYFLDSCCASLSKEADVFNSHTYIFGYETPNSKILEWERENKRLASMVGKEHFIGEFGSNQCVGSTRQSDIDLYERGVLMARIVVNLLNGGACGVSYWNLIDQFYDKKSSYMAMQQLGLWKYLKREYSQESYYDKISCDYEVRPQYYSYSLLSRFLHPQSEIFPIHTGYDFFAATAVRNKKGKWVYVFANQEEKDIAVNIENSLDKDKGKYEVYVYSKTTLPSDDSQISPSETVRGADKRISYILPSNSVVVMREK